MATLRIYDFDGVLIPDGKNHNNAIVRAVKMGDYPKGASNQDQAIALLQANPLNKETKQWVDALFLKSGVRFIKSEAFKETLDNTQEQGGTSIIVSASAFEGVINHMVEKAGLSAIISPEYVFTVSNKKQSLIPGLKADMIKIVAQRLELTSAVFLDDNENNVQEVAKLNGVTTENGQLSVTAMKVDKMRGLEDIELLENARTKELEYNIKDALQLERKNNHSEEPLYMNSSEAVEAAWASAGSEESIYENDPRNVLTAGKLDSIHVTVQPRKQLTQLEQAELAVKMAMAAPMSKRSNKEILKAAQEVLSKLKNGQGQHPEGAVAKVNPVKKAAQGLLSKLKGTPKMLPTKEELDSFQRNRRATLKKIKRETALVPISVQELLAQGNISLQNTKGVATRSDLSKLTQVSVESRVKILPVPPIHNTKGIGQEKPRVALETKPKPAGRKL